MLRFNIRGRRKFFKQFHDFVQSSTKLKLVIFFGLLYPMVWLLIRFTYTDRVKVLVLDRENDIENCSSQGKWNIKNWDYVNKENLGFLFRENGLSPLKIKEETEIGFWLATKKNQDSRTIVLDNFQYYYPVETTIGIQFYIEGPGQIEISFRSDFRWTISTYIIRSNRDQQDGTPGGEKKKSVFCSHIVPLVFQGLIDKIEIKARLDKEDAFVAIDKILVTMGKHGGSRNLMLTMIPTNWCKFKAYDYSWNPDDPESTNPSRHNYLMY